MVSEVLKRDGRRVPFDETRIRTAIELAITDSNINGLDKQTVVDNIINEVKTKISNSIETEIDVETIQNYVVQSMKALKLSKLAKSYTSYRNKRTRIREKKSSLMRSIDEMNNATAKSSDSKRENANIDGDTAMGTMLKFGTTASKEYYLNEVIPEEMSNAHREGYIHIHDLDFHSLTTTCAVRDTRILLKVNNNVFATTFAYFDDYFTDNQNKIDLSDIKIFHNGEFVDIKWCSRRKVKEDERVYKINTRYDALELTENHQVPVIRDNQEQLLYVKDIRIGDELKITKPINENLTEINCIDLFKNIDDICIENTELLRNIAHDNGFITKFYKCLQSSGVGVNYKYLCKLSLREYFSVRHLFIDYLDEHQLILNIKQGKSHGFPSYLKLTPTLGKFIGYIFTEGYVSFSKERHGVVFTNANADMLNEYEELVKELFDVVTKKTLKKDSLKCYDINIMKGHSYIAELFNGPFGVKLNSLNIDLPNWIFNANHDFIVGFISGLVDGDGGVHYDFANYNYTTSCKKLAYDVHYLLNIVGVCADITEKVLKGTTVRFNNKEYVRKANSYEIKVRGSYVDVMPLVYSILYNKNSKDVDRKPFINNKSGNVLSIQQIDYTDFVYDIETESHYFTANSFVIHNCTQIGIGKLLDKGFSTGHGHLRSPNSINTAAALACIAIQSNQNDQHGGQSIPTFDYGLAPYVAKSFISNIIQYLDMNEVSTEDLQDIKKKLNKLYEKNNRHLLDEKTLNKIESIIYDVIGTDYVIPGMCIRSAIKYTDRQTYQAMEALIHNLNTMNSRAGAQVE